MHGLSAISWDMLRLSAVLLLALALAACGGGQARVAQPNPPSGLGSLGLGSPVELAKSASIVSYSKQPGGYYQTDPPFSFNQVARAGDYAVYTPDWNAPEPNLDGLAWGMYAYDLLGLTGEQPLHLTFTETLPAGIDCWIGLGNQVRETWDWSLYPADADLVIHDLAPYTAAGDKLVLAIVFTGSGNLTLC